MTEQILDSVDKLAEVIRNMQKCLQCTICLHTITDPVKTRCGHRFCRECIQPVIQKKHALCPLCNSVLQRRNISADEHMQAYINYFQQLITAIELDSGIDVTTYSTRRRTTYESCSSEATDRGRPDVGGNNEQSSSSIRIKDLRRPTSQLNRSVRKTKKTSKLSKGKIPERSKDKKDNADANGITKYLSKYGLSGVQSLPLTNRPGNYQDESSMESRVQTWLETLPKSEPLDDPNIIAAILPDDATLDDTLTYSVSQNCPDGKIDKSKENREIASKLPRPANGNDESCTRHLPERRSSKSSLRHGSNANEGERSRDLYSNRALPFLHTVDDAVPSTSGITKWNDGSKEKNASPLENANNQEKLNDVQRTSPCNMLPAMKKNWSSVVKFGKEMRTKKKKLKSLSVSIENKNKTRPCDESPRGAIKNTVQQGMSRREKENESNVSESTMKAGVDRHGLEEKENLPKIETTCRREQEVAQNYEGETSPKHRGNRSMSEDVQPARESSFITLEQGEQVHISNLNSCQMNDIIGVVDSQDNDRWKVRNDVERNELPSTSRCNLPGSPARNGPLSSPQATPVKRPIEQSLNAFSELNESRKSPLASEAKRDGRTTEMCSTSGRLSPPTAETPHRGRLSLKRRSTDRKSNESVISNADPRLLAVKRDLNQQMDRDREEAAGDADAVELTSETRDQCEGSKCPSPSLRRPTTSSGKKKNDGNSSRDKCLVTFKKLGKVFKERKKRVSFLYLGSTRRRSLCRNYTMLSPRKLCNPITAGVQDAGNLQEVCRSENSFGSNTRITLNDTMPVEHAVENDNRNCPMETESVAKTVAEGEKEKSSNAVQNDLSLNKAASTKRIDMYKDNASKGITPIANSVTKTATDSEDVLFVSVYGNEDTELNKRKVSEHNSPVKRRQTKSIPEKTVSKRGIPMLSPKKDSQLKYLSLETPTIDTQQTPKFVEQTEAARDASARRSDFFEIRGAHSRALIGKLQDASESSDADSSSLSRKRKRSNKRVYSIHRMETERMRINEGLMVDNEYDSDHSLSSRTTCIRSPKARSKETAGSGSTDDNTKKRCYTDSSNSRNARAVDTVSLSSDTDVDKKDTTIQKKGYRRIVPLLSSDTDSPVIVFVNDDADNANVTAANGPVQAATSPAQKRKRAASSGSDSDVELNEIVTSWSADVNPLERLKKKGKVEQAGVSSNSMNTSREKRNDTLLKPQKSFSNSANLPSSVLPPPHKRPAESFARSTSGRSNSAIGSRQESSESKDIFGSTDSPDFNWTVDAIQSVQNIVSKVHDNAKDSDSKFKAAREPSLMQDNFDEIFADVDTDAFIDEYSENRESHRYSEQKEGHGSSERLAGPCPRSSNRDIVISERSNGSDKENKCKSAGKMYDNGNDDVQTSRKDALQYNKPQEKLKQLEVSSRESLQTSNCSKRTSVQNSVRASTASEQTVIDKEENRDSTLKGTCFEDDSLMDVTQHYLLIKQFEEDLFGKPSSESAEKKGQANQQRTPQKESDVVLKKKDTEHSAGEDDIVENTPDAKTRSLQSSSSVQKGSIGSAVSKISERQFSSPSSIIGSRSNTTIPLCRRSIHPLYQSTPKAQQSTAKAKHSAISGSKKLEAASNASEPFGRQRKEVAGSKGNAGRRKLCFVCSGLVPGQIEQVKKLGQIVNAEYVTRFDQDVTHVIVKADKKSNGANKTLKYLQGIAHRKWIVVYQWVIDSLKEKKLVNEEPYEAVDSRTLEAGPRSSRLSEKGLFEGFVFQCVGPYVDVSVEQYQDLLRAAGATVVGSLEALASEKKKLKIIVIQADDYDYEIIVGWYKKAQAVPIVHDWVVECISQYKLISFYPYLQELSRQDVLALGYPEFLVEEEPDGDSDSVCDVST